MSFLEGGAVSYEQGTPVAGLLRSFAPGGVM